MKKTITTVASTVLIISAIGQNVGFGTTTPNYPVTVEAKESKGIAQTSGSMEIGFSTDSTNATAFVRTWSQHNLGFTTGNGNTQVYIDNANGRVGIHSITPKADFETFGTLRIYGNGEGINKILTSDNKGIATWQGATYFAAYRYLDLLTTSSTPTSNLFNNREYESVGGLFSTGGNIFTAPITGIYHISGSLLLSLTTPGTTSGTASLVIVKGSENYRSLSITVPPTGSEQFSFGFDILMIAGDALTSIFTPGSQNITIQAGTKSTFFNGHLVR